MANGQTAASFDSRVYSLSSASSEADEEVTSFSHLSYISDANPGQLQTADTDRAIDSLCESCGPDDGKRRPLRIILIGKHGSGKSSFINSVAASLSEDRWREYATIGILRSSGAITTFNHRYEKCCNAWRDRYKKVLLPTLIDVPGLTNNPDEKVEELLKLLLYGHIKEDEAIMKVYPDCQNLSVEGIRQKYKTCYPKMRVDRVIFVASAAMKLPTELMQCVYKATHPDFDQPERRVVPVFGVLTHMDEVDLNSRAFLEKKDAFKKELGLIDLRLLICSNYTDTMDSGIQRTKRVQPELDVPIVEFMQEVCDGARMVAHDNQVLPNTEDKQEAVNETPIHEIFLEEFRAYFGPAQEERLIAILAGIVTWFLLVFFILTGPDADVREQCHNGRLTDTPVCKQLSVKSTLIRWFLDLLLPAIVGGAVYYWRQRQSREADRSTSGGKPCSDADDRFSEEENHDFRFERK